MSALAALMARAAALRDEGHGDVVTYSRKVFIPLTNLCRDVCSYCTFAHEPGDARAHTMSPDEILQVAEAGRRLGCKEALFTLGDRPEAR
jgi:FO synthase